MTRPSKLQPSERAWSSVFRPSKVYLGAGVILQINPLNTVDTVWTDGRKSSAWRDLTETNLLEAASQGYAKTLAGMFLSLVEHEALHTIVSRRLYGEESLVLRESAGVKVTLPYWRRLHEEAVVLALQIWLNTNQITPAIKYEPDLCEKAWLLCDKIRTTV